MIQTLQNKGNSGRLLTFPDVATPARPIARDGYGRPITHIFGLRLPDTFSLSRPFELRRSGGVVELVQGRTQGRARA